MRPRVLWLIKGLGLGGAEKLLELSAIYADRTRYEYRAAFLLPWKHALVPNLTSAGIPVECLDHRIPGDPRVMAGLVGLLRRERIDILHAHLPYSAIIGRCAARLAGTPRVVYTEHNLQERYRPLTRFLNRATLPLCDMTIAVSEEVRRSLLARVPGKSANIRTILNGVDADNLTATAGTGSEVRKELGIESDRPIVGVVSVFRKQKRLDVWLRAAQAIASADPRVIFVVVGDGPLRDEIHGESRRLGLDGRVIFAGLRPDGPRLIRAFDVFMLSSDFEGLPVAVLESMALGVPVVATRVGGLSHVLQDGACGFLVEPGDPQALASKAVALLVHPALRQSFSAAAAARAREQFSIRRMVRQVEETYDQVLRGEVPEHETVPEIAAPGSGG